MQEYLAAIDAALEQILSRNPLTPHRVLAAPGAFCFAQMM